MIGQKKVCLTSLHLQNLQVIVFDEVEMWIQKDIVTWHNIYSMDLRRYKLVPTPVVSQ